MKTTPVGAQTQGTGEGDGMGCCNSNSRGGPTTGCRLVPRNTQHCLTLKGNREQGSLSWMMEWDEKKRGKEEGEQTSGEW